MKFRERKSMKLTYRQQGYIHFKCQMFSHLPEAEQTAIRDACNRTGYGDAVLEYITTDASSIYISTRYYISEKWLATQTGKVFRELAKKL